MKLSEILAHMKVGDQVTRTREGRTDTTTVTAVETGDDGVTTIHMEPRAADMTNAEEEE